MELGTPTDPERARAEPNQRSAPLVGAAAALVVAIVAVTVALVVVTRTSDDVATDQTNASEVAVDEQGDSPSTTSPAATTAPSPTAPHPSSDAASDAPEAPPPPPRPREPVVTHPPAPARPSDDPNVAVPTLGRESYGRVVAVVWSDMNSAGGDVSHEMNVRQARYGVPLVAVLGDTFTTLRSGTVAVVYDPGFVSLYDAVSWCSRIGANAEECFAVGLNDEWGPQDRSGTGRLYLSDL